MIVTLPLEEMSMEDKISTMEILWEEICKDSNNLPSPLWHAEILQEREKRLAEGKDCFEDWEKVKDELRNSLL